MRIDDVHDLVVHARRMEREIASAAEMLAATATGDSRGVLDSVAHGARIRQLLWDSRLPDTNYISTGRSTALTGPDGDPTTPTDAAGLSASLIKIATRYETALSDVTEALDPLTHQLLSEGLAEVRAAIVAVGPGG